MNTLLKLRQCLTPSARRALPWLLTAFIVNSVLEVTGVASVLPFMILVADPGQIDKQPLLHYIFGISGLQEHRSFVVGSGLAVLGFLALGNLFSAALLVISVRFLNRESANLSTQLLRHYIGQPYIWFLGQNTSVLGRCVLAEIPCVPLGILLPLLRLISKALAALLIMAGLVYVNAAIALVTGILLGGAYCLVWLATKDKLTEIGQKRLEAEAVKYRTATEALSGIKTTMILGREQFFIENYSEVSHRLAGLQSDQGILNETPRYLLELLAFGSVICILLAHLMRGSELAGMLPVISIFTLGAYRLMPALQQGFSYVSSIRSQLPALHYLYEDLRFGNETARNLEGSKARLPLGKEIELCELRFSYPGKAVPVINGLSLTIKRYSCIGFVGTTGAGKTTLVDLLLGLLNPDSGHIEIDGKRLGPESIRAWQNNIGYVSQDIYLSDDTILANIALGIPKDEVNRDAVVAAAKMANLHDFVSQDLAEGYDTTVGERGVRISGGQRQRIGIARALYHNPALLVLDEATSSLDGITESAVMDAVHNLAHKMTIVMIAHRLSTVQQCDCIHFLKEGRVIDHGTFEELMARNTEFRDMARVGKNDLCVEDPSLPV